MEYSDDEAYRADPELSKMVDYFKAAHETKEEREKRLAKEAAEAKAEQEKKQQEQKQNAQTSKTDAQQSVQVNAQGGLKMKFCQNCGTQLQPGARFCPNCGTPTGQVANAGAGTNANQNANNASVRKQEFVGTIRKCPSCGAEVPAFAVTCPVCGHELNEDKVDKSVKEFFDKLANYSDGYETEQDDQAKWKTYGVKYILFFFGACAIMLSSSIEDDLDLPRVIPIISGIVMITVGIFWKTSLTQQQQKKRNLIETFIVPNNKESVIEFLLLSCSQIQPGANPITKEGKNVSLWNKVWKTKIKQTIAKSNILFASDKDSQEKVKAIRKQYKV